MAVRTRPRLGLPGPVWLAALALLAAVIAALVPAAPAGADGATGADGAAQAAQAAGAQTPPDEQPGGPRAFRWDGEGQRAAFEHCRKVADWVVRGAHAARNPGWTYHLPLRTTPRPQTRGVELEVWNDAVNSDFLDARPFQFPKQEFTYRPQCHLLLPDDHVTRLPSRFMSAAWSRCHENASRGERVRERPPIVPAWYWEVALAVRDCSLLLPLGAFGLGPETTPWSGWTEENEVDYPRPDPHVVGEAIVAEYRACREFIQWRMDHGKASWGGPGDLYDDPPRGASPLRVWHEALHFWAGDVRSEADMDALDRETKPVDWKPNCEILLLHDPCRPSGQGNRSLIPELCVGPHATSHYDIGFSELHGADSAYGTDGTPVVSRNLWGGTTNLAYLLGKGAVQVALWATDWAFGFDIRTYDPLAMRISTRYEISLLDHRELHLRELLWLVLLSWAGLTALRGRLVVAGAEILVTVVLLLLSGVLLHQREMYMDAVWNLMDRTSTTLLVAGTGGDPSRDASVSRDELVGDLQREIHFVFIEETYDYLNWGEALGRSDDPDNPLRRCAAVRYHILEMGPHGTDPWPRRMMRDAGRECHRLAEFNADPDGNRLLGALLVMLSAVFVAALVVVTALTIVLAKLVALLLFAVVPFVAVVAILPSQGRRLTWSWATTLLQMTIAVIATSFLLSLLLLTLRELTSLTAKVDLIERFALMDLIVLVVFGARRSVLKSGQMFAARFGEYLSTARGSGTSWSEAAANAGPGVNLLTADALAAYAVAAPAAAAGTAVMSELRARRAARLGYRNLRRLSYWKRGANAANERWVRDNAGRRFLAGSLHVVDPAQPGTIPVRHRPLP